jgi:EAL and modified HD-GYP domain-containing signal transduction protein
MESSIYLGRLPIYDNNKNIYAYELLYRNTDKNSAAVNDNLHATARVLVNALNYIGLNNLTRKKIAFIKADDKTLFDDIIYAISPGHFVLEILEHSVISSELLHRIELLHKKGYRFALNHYLDSDTFHMHFQSLLPIVDYVKIDMSKQQNPLDVLPRLSKYSLHYIAEKIEDEEDFKRAKDAGFHYYQGYYFSSVNLFKKEKIDPDSSLLLELIYLLKTNATIDALIEKFDASPYLTLNLLKFIRLHEGLTHQSVASIEQALVLIGRERLVNWIELMLYAHDEESEEESNYARQLSVQAKQRACLMEELARHIKKSEKYAHAAYMTGLLSVSEVLFRDKFSDLIKQMHIESTIANALKKSGELGQLLQLAIAVEMNDLGTVNSIIGQLFLSQKELNKCVMLSYRRSSSTPH